ncbi:MAG: tyrosine--tRNA ligase [Nitriliruptoraceae bacterium]
MTTSTSPPPPTTPAPGDVLDVLRARGFVQDITDEAGLAAALAAGPITYYVGFDPTAPSLHAGNLVGMMAMAWLQRHGHRPIALAGGATGRIGDPSGRNIEREVLDDATIDRHLAGIRRQLGLVLELSGAGDALTGGEDAAAGSAGLLVDNHDWTAPVSILDFLREVGVHASVNQMIARESVKRRLEEREQGLTFAEFSYQLLQAFDFAHLHEYHGCVLQGGGSDQWGNIVAGIDLIRHRGGGPAFGLVWPLLTTADGSKFGKSAGNAIWLDAELTSPYAYYQYWLNAADADVVRFLKLFTFLDLERIADLERELQRDPSARVAHRELAREATRIIHGDAGVAAAEGATAVLFGDAPFADLSDQVLSAAFEEAPSVTLERARLEGEGVGLLEAMTAAGLTRTNAEARRLVQQGAVRLNNARIEDPQYRLGPGDLASESTAVLRSGKKRYGLLRFA